MNESALLSGLAKVLDEVSETQSKNAKVERLSAYLRNLSAEDAAHLPVVAGTKHR